MHQGRIEGEARRRQAFAKTREALPLQHVALRAGDVGDAAVAELGEMARHRGAGGPVVHLDLGNVGRDRLAQRDDGRAGPGAQAAPAPRLRRRGGR